MKVKWLTHHSCRVLYVQRIDRRASKRLNNLAHRTVAVEEYMSKPRDGASLQRQLNRATAEDRRRAYTQASKSIRDKLQSEMEKAKVKKIN